MKIVEIAGRKIGPGQPCFIIAEAGVNHNCRVDLALRLVELAAEAGVDAVKFQTYKTDAVYSPGVPKADYMKKATAAGESMTEMARKLELPFEVFVELQAHCRRRNVVFLSSPFDEESAGFLATLDVPAFKIPSGEITNEPMLERIARTGKPVILSTGMAELDEIGSAIRVLNKAGNRELLLLHCVSQYPAAPADVNLRAMRTMEAAFDVPVGFSDHTLGTHVTVAAVALGACILEKHFTVDRDLPGPDHQASLDPAQLKAMVAQVREVESALGDGRKIPTARERETAALVRKSLVAAVAIPAGAVLVESMLAIKRPGNGLAPSLRPSLVGRKARRAIPSGTLLSRDMIE